MIGLLKMEFGWGTLKKEDIIGYVPLIISKDDFKDITGEEYTSDAG
ncbi:XkdX family protein [Companilactobacillus baiquanensis]|uniref:XkdX family protein n=1 Tax=Companilactobacillus baiquanensis TaxID=2486005 RepID=A0ABW1UYR4_9LACO|nr:XkdX family protein [Companilactobacillus baiquanensis]